MKLFNRILIILALISNLHCSINSMEQPLKLNKVDREILFKFLTNYHNPSFTSTRSDKELKKIILLSHNVMEDPKELENYSQTLQGVYSTLKKNKENINTIFNEMVQKAKQELERRAPKEKQKPAMQAAPQPVCELKKVSSASQATLNKIVQAELNGEIDYLNTRSNFTLKSAIDLVNKVINNKEELAALKKSFPMSKKELIAVLERIRQKASIVLKHAQDIENKIVLEAQKQPAVVAPVANLEKPEEEIRPNKLYIGLDVKEFNTNSKPILWRVPIDTLTAKIHNAKFEPNDYFHITIAWYESKNPISPEIVAKMEKALAHATEIFKIVFPEGVRGIGLLDGAVLLGQNAIVFRVAESEDLKKLQDIFLKFLSFEKIEGIKFNTFKKENPIHITLGKIWPAKSAAQFQQAVSGLLAPEGARASGGQGFTINTFRLTYAVAGQAWQEKMSYKF